MAAYTRLGGVFSSVMTGNLTLMGLAAATTSRDLAAHIGVAIGGYICGVALAGQLGRLPRRRRALWPASATGALALELLAYLGIAAGWELSRGDPTGSIQFELLAVATIAMGLQAAAMRELGVPLSTTYLTGTLTGAVAALASGKRGQGLRLGLGVLGAHVLGAATGGGLILAAPALLPALPGGLVAGVVAAVTARGVSRQPS